jgi:hypothetical protein
MGWRAIQPFISPFSGQWRTEMLTEDCDKNDLLIIVGMASEKRLFAGSRNRLSRAVAPETLPDHYFRGDLCHSMSPTLRCGKKLYVSLSNASEVNLSRRR